MIVRVNMKDLSTISDSDISSTVPVYNLLTKHLHSYLLNYKASEKTRVKTTVKNFLQHLYIAGEVFEVKDSKAFSQAIKNWKVFYYESSRCSQGTTRNYFSSFLKYIRHLISENILPKFRLPSVNITRATSRQPPTASITITRQATSPFMFKCTSVDGTDGPPHDLSLLSKYGEIGLDIACAFKELQTGSAAKSQPRGKRVFINYLFYLTIKHKSIDLTNPIPVSESIYGYHRYLYKNRGEKAASSVNDDWRKFITIGKYLITKGLFPNISFPPHYKKADKFARRFKKNNKLLSMSLKNINRFDDDGNKIINAYELSFKILDDNFLEALERDERYVFDQIRAAAIHEVKEVIRDFQKGQELIGKCDIEYLQEVYKETGKLVDPNMRCDKGQCISFFSSEHPQGLINILGWIWHEYYGLTLNRSFSGFSQIHDHIGGTGQIKRYLGLCHENALPLFIVIIGEAAVNVESLERATIKNKNGKNIFLMPTENGKYVRFTVRKPRAKKYISKLIEVGDSTEINAYVCLRAILEMTARYREADYSDKLWISPYSSKSPTPSHIGATAFKYQFKKFIDRHDKLAELDFKYIDRARIRVSAGIIEWFESGGDAVSVAKRLGNKPETALKDYIPKEIQEILFRREIRRFQDILIIASCENNNLTCKALGGISADELTQRVNQLNKNKAIVKGPLYAHLFPVTNNKAVDIEKVYFVLSEHNIALLKLLTEYIHEQKLAYPAKIKMNNQFYGQPLSYWFELWAAVKYTLKNSPDRGYKLTYENGIELSEKVYNSIEFPLITAHENNHV